MIVPTKMSLIKKRNYVNWWVIFQVYRFISNNYLYWNCSVVSALLVCDIIISNWVFGLGTTDLKGILYKIHSASNVKNTFHQIMGKLGILKVRDQNFWGLTLTIDFRLGFNTFVAFWIIFGFISFVKILWVQVHTWIFRVLLKKCCKLHNFQWLFYVDFQIIFFKF